MRSTCDLDRAADALVASLEAEGAGSAEIAEARLHYVVRRDHRTTSDPRARWPLRAITAICITGTWET